MKSGGHGVFIRNYFGKTQGYNDVVDFTGSQRGAGPIVHFINNVFMGSSDDDLRDFPAAARRAAGFELSAVQAGLMPSDFKPMPAVGAGAYEIRVHVEGEWRVIYVAKFARAVYALHAFHKKKQKTRQEDIEIARTRYAQAKEADE